MLAGHFTENNERKQKFEETGDSRQIYQNELHKACFQHNMVYGDLRDLHRTTASGKYYVRKHLISLKIQNMMDVNVALLQEFTIFLIKHFLVVVVNVLVKAKSCKPVINRIVTQINY